MILNKFNDYISTSIPPGPKIIKLKYIINFQKGSTMLYVFYLMNYFNNYSLSAYLYLALHGTYGIIWLLKDTIMPDKNWNKKATIISSITGFSLVLLPYWIIAYITISSHVIISNLRVFFCVFFHTLGCVLMMASDSQKYFTLKYKKGLINEGWFKKIRNTNYLGEMMIYLTYAMISKSYISYFILIYIWSLLFIPNMLNKDKSIKKKDGGIEYINNSYLLIPSINIVCK